MYVENKMFLLPGFGSVSREESATIRTTGVSYIRVIGFIAATVHFGSTWDARVTCLGVSYTLDSANL